MTFTSATGTLRQRLGKSRLSEQIHAWVDHSAGETHYRLRGSAEFAGGALRVAARVQYDGGAGVELGGMNSTIVPESGFARRVLIPSLPVAALRGSQYFGWRAESATPLLPLTAFYERHDLGREALDVAGLEFRTAFAPNPLFGFPGLTLTAGAAHILDEPFRGRTNYWIGLRWQP